MQKANMRKFYPRRYESLPDNQPDDDESHFLGDQEDHTSFSSVRLAKDQDKPSRKNLGKWKRKGSKENDILSNGRNSWDPADIYLPGGSSSDSGSNLSSVLDQVKSDQDFSSPRERRILLERDTLALVPPVTSERNSSRKTSQDSFLSYLASPFDSQPAKQGVPDKLPSPKENRHPQNSNHLESASMDARASAALSPSAALNLVQYWNGLRPTEQQLLETARQNVKDTNGSSRDPLLVALQVVRLKRELKKLRRDAVNRRTFPLDESSSSDAVLAGETPGPPAPVGSPSSGPTKTGKKRVRFAKKLVTEVHERPFTKPEEMERLYFVYGELEELEWDRSTVELDQFECIIQNDGDLEAYVEVEHNSRKLHNLVDDGIPHSLSDLSLL